MRPPGRDVLAGNASGVNARCFEEVDKKITKGLTSPVSGSKGLAQQYFVKIETNYPRR
jgi:hypothetical protein